MEVYPEIGSRLGKHLFRAKYKGQKLGLFALYAYFFLFAVWLPNGQHLAVIKETFLQP